MRCRFAAKEDLKPADDPKRKLAFYGTPDNEFDLEHHYGDKKFVFVFTYGDLKTTQKKANDWNNLGLQSRVIVSERGTAVLKGVLPYEAGLSIRQLLTFHARLKAEKQAFEAFNSK